ncbi:MAG: protein lplB, partial [Paenibacillus sp.]|nr:protein lplB [Paenibacillus sp.]
MSAKKRAHNLPLHLMILPALVLIVIYSYGPMLGIVIAFQKFVPALGIFESKWTGWDNFRYVMAMPDTGRVLWNTVLISFMKIVAGLIVPITVSLLLNEVRKELFKRGIQTLVYLPHFLSWVILGGILIDILSPSTGIVNQLLAAFGIEPIFFLGSNDWFRYILVLS